MRSHGISIGRVDSSALPMPASHRHTEVEINFVLAGRVDYWMGAGEVSFRAGEMAAFWGAHPHRLVRSSPEAQFYYLTVPLEALLSWNLPGGFAAALTKGRPLVVRTARDTGLMVRQWRRWCRDLAPGPPNPLRPAATLEIRAAVERMALSASARPGRRPRPTRGVPPGVARLAVEIAARFREPVTLDELARAAGLHPSYASDAYRKSFGTTINEAVNRSRIARAQDLLIHSERGVLEIAFDSGFQSPGRFYEWFRRVAGIPPESFRKSMRAACGGNK